MFMIVNKKVPDEGLCRHQPRWSEDIILSFFPSLKKMFYFIVRFFQNLDFILFGRYSKV